MLPISRNLLNSLQGLLHLEQWLEHRGGQNIPKWTWFTMIFTFVWRCVLFLQRFASPSCHLPRHNVWGACLLEPSEPGANQEYSVHALQEWRSPSSLNPQHSGLVEPLEIKECGMRFWMMFWQFKNLCLFSIKKKKNLNALILQRSLITFQDRACSRNLEYKINRMKRLPFLLQA